MTLRNALADKEPLCRLELCQQLATGLMVVGEACDGRDAATALVDDERPDLLLLDVQIPELGGFGVIAALEAPTTTRW